MIVVLCGAYRNSGDHLIGDRARALLRKHVDADIVTLDRKAIEPQHYETFNKARRVLLCGGPAYQREMYPKVYPLEREKVTPPIVPYGLGWKSPAKKAPDTFKFAAPAEKFIKDIHGKIELSSARDPLTVEVLNHAGVDNVLMTGCPAWYDLTTFENPYVFKDEVKNLVLSMPAVMQPGTLELMEWLTQRFPKARRTAAFHHGIVPAWTKIGLERGSKFVRFSASALRRGWRVTGLTGSLPRMEALYGNADLHIGYRVHAHLLCLSRRIPSILINEDSRGVGQAKALGADSLIVEGDNIEPFKQAVERHFETRGETVAGSVETMRQTFPTMKRFLETL